MVGGVGVEVSRGGYGEVGGSMGGMARLRRVAASSWAGVSCARVSWAGMLFERARGRHRTSFRRLRICGGDSI